MRRRGAFVGVVLVVGAASGAGAQNVIPDGFRAAFESQVRRGRFAVVARPDIPTVPIHGLDGKQTDAYFSVDVKRGDWKASTGFLDLNQVANDQLAIGEVMEVVDVTYRDKDNRIDVRLVSRDAHDVMRTGGGSAADSREPVGTNFKFFFPFPLSSVLAAPAAVDYVESYLRPFRSEGEARAFASTLAPPAGGRPGGQTAAKSEPKQIKTGMTPLEVLDVLGKPDRELSFGAESKWTYRDVVVVFENGRVKKVEF